MRLYGVGKLWLVLAFSVLLIAGCTQPSSPFATDDLMQTAQPSQERPIITGCDGICDAFEQSHTESSCYKPDCLGIIDEQAMPPQPANPSQQPSTLQQPEQQEFVVEATNSTYAAVDTINKPTGWLETGQSADIMLSGIGV